MALQVQNRSRAWIKSCEQLMLWFCRIGSWREYGEREKILGRDSAFWRGTTFIHHSFGLVGLQYQSRPFPMARCCDRSIRDPLLESHANEGQAGLVTERTSSHDRRLCFAHDSLRSCSSMCFYKQTVWTMFWLYSSRPKEMTGRRDRT